MNGSDAVGLIAARRRDFIAPIRRGSLPAGHAERSFWRPTTRTQTRRILLAAKRYELTRRGGGERNGPLGHVALEVLELMVNLVHHRSGRLEPSLVTLMRLLKRSRDAIVRALRNLRAHGFIDWIRRYVSCEGSGRGPQVMQTANAYRLNLPRQANRPSPPLPDDWSCEQERRGTEREGWKNGLSREELPFEVLGHTALAESLARLALLITQRESARQPESPG
ncbi:MAG: helix-turn-helix domain-containing protein [Rhizobiaceae bacterium]|nr:helix-turn-helix domain-containing protein [Rhizobiaceae bacterium]